MFEAHKSDYFPAFDVLRIILASVVALGHSGMSIWPHAGDLAVQVFFALSGWLIGGILLRSTSGDLPKFYFHRAARIWIPYLVAIALLVLVSSLKDRITFKWLEFVFYDLTFVYNFFGPRQLATARSEMPLAGTGNHFWSICAEEQFYLLAPLLITIPARIGRSIWFWSLLCAGILASPLWAYFGSISLGVLAAVVGSRYGSWHSHRSAMAAIGSIATFSFAATYMELVPYRVGAPIVAISTVLLLAQSGPHSRVLAFLGGISFPMYLNHWIATFAINAVLTRVGTPHSTYSQFLSVALGLIIASALYLCIDRTIKNNRDRYYTIWRGKFVAISGFALVTIGLIGGLALML